MIRPTVKVALLVLVLAQAASAAEQHAVAGMILSVDPAHRTFEASIEAIPNVMAAMSMPFTVRDAAELTGLVPGAIVDFTLVVDKNASYAEGVRIRRYQNVEQDPLAARRLALLTEIARGVASKALAVGATVPDFRLIDQRSRPVSLTQLRGKVVGINFMYTTCRLPDFCLRIVSHFAALQKRFKAELGRDLMFLTITIDPERDQPEVLARYASQWNPGAGTWHFLTGPVPEVQRVLARFGVAAFPNEGLMDHSLNTVLIDRNGTLVANVEGNKYSTDQLGDLIQSVLGARPDGRAR